MNTGALRHIALIEQPAELPPPVPSTWPCAVLDDQVGGLTLAGRFHPDVSVNTRLVLKGHRYHVDRVSNRQERDIEMVLAVHEVFD